MATENLEKPKVEEKPVKVLDEWVFWDEDDLRRMWLNGTGIPVSPVPTNNMVDEYHDICLDVDSYVFVFSGRRSGGKTTSMTDEAAKAAILYPNMRLLSNYPIEFIALYLDGHTRHVKSEDLDLYKLLCFDQEYHNCLICIDEAPDIIIHMPKT
jgi:hypothetical protein